jgi:hypothetical protein
MIDGRLMMAPASPLQYLERWRLYNFLFNDEVRLVGLRTEGNRHRIVISQRDFGSDTPTWEDLERSMTEDYKLGRLPMHQQFGGYDARAYLRSRFAVFDVRPANCARLPGSTLIMPFDVIPPSIRSGRRHQVERDALRAVDHPPPGVDIAHQDRQTAPSTRHELMPPKPNELLSK